MGKILIRRPNHNDIEELHSFFTKVIKDTFAKEGISELVDDMEEEIASKKSYLDEDLQSNGEKRYFLVAHDAECTKIIGTIEYGPSSELIQNCTNGALKDSYEIGTVFVDPDHQKRGIGTLLLNVMLITLEAKGIKEFCLDSGYGIAQKVWKEKLGKPDYCLKDYWGEGSDHMIWKRGTKDIPILFNR
ncbi:GNAT family N-acetyltransferase [Bacillus sp. FJAT-49736]|uniref:GNAT family N-acetyltransferase n=1 Tax=Bacillus sp. FJAT-49736 TaxID=2833582 RepID=UPI001BC8E029|nr:GNAT family N-acetyltransferase [Bacillus sp. FJAT-49736]MBS4172726.1 GNAT family N-acetyltransferase [Bacillus sp. FJAT-49736]